MELDKWTFNGAVHRRDIGNGLMRLVVRPADLSQPDGQWKVQINGGSVIVEPEPFNTVDEAKLWAEHRARAYCKSIISELSD